MHCFTKTSSCTSSGVENAGRGVQSFGFHSLLAFGLGVVLLATLNSPVSASVAVEKQAAGSPVLNLPGQDQPSFSISHVIEKAEHLIRKDPTRAGHYRVDDPAYRVEFAPEGVIYHQKQDGKLSRDRRIRFQLKAFRSGDRTIVPFRTGDAIHSEENRLTYQRTPSVEEVFEARKEGVEQSWIIQRPFSGKVADLTIDGQLDTALTPSSNASGGIDFTDDAGRYVTTYGEVTVIDHDGKKLTVSPILSGAMLTITIPANWLAKASYPLIVDPLIGSNIQVDNLTTADNYPAIGFDGTNYLIVWQTGTPSADGLGTTAIKGVRVSNAGTVLDVTPLAIGDTANKDDEFPSVAYDSLNARYIVVWMTWNGATSADIFRNTVTTTGTVGTPANILAGGTRILAYPTVACCDLNDNYYVVYGWGGDGATNFTQYLGQTYNRNTHAAATISDPTATVSSGTITPDTEPRSAPRLYSLSTTKYLLTWETFGVDANGDLSANLLTVTSTPTYSWGTQVSVAVTAATLERYPRAAFDGTNALIVYQQGGGTAADVLGRFVTPGASNLTPGSSVTVSAVGGSGQAYPDLAYLSGACSANPVSRYLVVWQDYRNSGTNPDIYGSTVTTGGTVETAVTISSDITYVKQLPVIAADNGGCGYLTAWSDGRNSGTTSTDIYAQRVGYPNIDNLSPTSGDVGGTISINGLNFGTDPGAGNRSTTTNNVKINGVQVADANITTWSTAAISFIIPTGTANGTYPVMVTAGSWTSNGSNLTVLPLRITTTALSSGYQWLNYTTNMAAAGGTTPYSWSVIAGALPTGLTLNGSTGLISGTPSAFGTFNFTVQVTDSTTPTPQTATQALSIVIYELSTIAVTPANPTINPGQTVQFTAMGTYSDSSSSDLTGTVAWGPTNGSVATVNAFGLATGVGPGSVTITATK